MKKVISFAITTIFILVSLLFSGCINPALNMSPSAEAAEESGVPSDVHILYRQCKLRL